MYIAIEGIKGAGKSFLIKSLKKYDLQRSSGVMFFPITAPMPANNPLEMIFNRNSVLQTRDDFIEYLFLQRAFFHNAKVQGSLIIGDRCLATSLVTRWNKWRDPIYTIKKVKKDYEKIRKPDVIIYLESPITVSLDNISKRIQKKTGIKDEKSIELCKASEVYHELLLDGLYNVHFSKAQIIKIPYTPIQNDIQKEIFSIIKYYKK